MKAGFGTVANLEDSTTPEERRRLYAVAMLDGWGEEWQRAAAPVLRLLWLIATAGGAKPSEESYPTSERVLEYWHEWSEEFERSQNVDTNEMESTLRSLAGV